jgi:hypothetical protein
MIARFVISRPFLFGRRIVETILCMAGNDASRKDKTVSCAPSDAIGSSREFWIDDGSRLAADDFAGFVLVTAFSSFR